MAKENIASGDTQFADSTEAPSKEDHAAVDILLDAELEAHEKGETSDPPKEDPPKEDPPVEDPPKEDPPVEDPPKEDPPVEDPPKEDPPVEDPPVEDPPVEDPPKEDPPKEDPPKEDPPVEDPPDPDADPEVDDVRQPPNLNKKNSESFKTLRDVAKGRKKEIVRLEAELVTAKETGGGGELSETQLKSLDTANQLLRTLDIEQDPHFKVEFQDKIDKAGNEVYDLAAKFGMSEDFMKQLKEANGVTSQSFSWWTKNVIDPLLKSEDGQANQAGLVIQQRLGAINTLEHDKGIAISEAAQDKSAFMEQRLEEAQARVAADEKVYNDKLDDYRKKVPWAAKQTVPKNATAEDKARIATDNKFYEFAEKMMPVMINPQNAATRFDVAASAILAYRYADELDAAATHINQLNARIEKLTNAGRMNKATAPPKAAPKADRTGLSLSNEAGVEAAMAAAGL